MALLVLLATTSASGDPLTWLVNLGVAGVVIALLVTGQLRTKSEVENLQAQIAQQAHLIEGFQNQLTGNTIPALTKFVQLAETIPANTAQMQADMEEVTRALQDLLNKAEEGRK